MHTHDADMARLSLLIQRILDTDTLSEAEGGSLLREAEAAHRSLESGDAEAVHQHVEQVALFTEALVRTEALALTDGRAVIEAARRLLTEEAGRFTNGA